MEHSVISLPPEIQSRLQSNTDLPSPPKVALRIIDLVEDPDLEIETVVNTLAMDPALSVKILRMANSAHYPYQNKVNNIEKAIMVIGLNGVLSLALSFSLAKSLRGEQGAGLNYTWYWHRALIAGSVSRSLGLLCNRKHLEELFTVAFIQDIGMLVLDKMEPSLYANLDFHQGSHHDILAHERNMVGTDHAFVGSWILSEWKFPDVFVSAVRCSDDPDLRAAITEDPQMVKCISAAGSIADLYLTQAGDEEILALAEQLERDLDMAGSYLVELLNDVGQMVQEKATLFEIDWQGGYEPESLLEKARDLLVNRISENLIR
jgi:HD-like signal output (HDOD) protein